MEIPLSINHLTAENCPATPPNDTKTVSWRVLCVLFMVQSKEINQAASLRLCRLCCVSQEVELLDLLYRLFVHFINQEVLP